MQTTLTRSLPHQAIRVLIAVAVLFIAGQLSIPWSPVPLSFQAVSALLIALLLDRRESLTAITLYLGLGAMGLPMFANLSGGLPILIGPTGGYLMGFLPGALVASFVAQAFPRRTFVSCFIATFLGSAVLFLMGVAQLSHFVGLSMAYQAGLVPFFFVEPLKMVFVALIAARASA